MRFVPIQYAGSAKDQGSILHEGQCPRNHLTVLGNKQQPPLQEELLHVVIGVDDRQLSEPLLDMRHEHAVVEKIEFFQVFGHPRPEAISL